jgi:hypothetical protein
MVTDRIGGSEGQEISTNGCRTAWIAYEMAASEDNPESFTESLFI